MVFRKKAKDSGADLVDVTDACKIKENKHLVLRLSSGTQCSKLTIYVKWKLVTRRWVRIIAEIYGESQTMTTKNAVFDEGLLGDKMSILIYPGLLLSYSILARDCKRDDENIWNKSWLCFFLHYMGEGDILDKLMAQDTFGYERESYHSNGCRQFLQQRTTGLQQSIKQNLRRNWRFSLDWCKQYLKYW